MLGGGYWTKHDAKRILNAVLNVECVYKLWRKRAGSVGDVPFQTRPKGLFAATILSNVKTLGMSLAFKKAR